VLGRRGRAAFDFVTNKKLPRCCFCLDLVTKRQIYASSTITQRHASDVRLCCMPRADAAF
jgi:hypothetical protein